MKYFTPELYLRANSSDDDVADRADEEWEQSIKKYQHYIDSLSNEMPPRVKKLAKTIWLHDAQLRLLAIGQDVLKSGSRLQSPLTIATLTLQQGETSVNLVYMLWDRVTQTNPRQGHPWSAVGACWLYDEIELVRPHPNRFHHRILLSDGSILDIPFYDVNVPVLPGFD
ncbi:MAG: hypothetical protein ABI353_05395 [Isosphaeraceae bacterium]